MSGSGNSPSVKAISGERVAFNAIRHYLHDPQMSNADARVIRDTFCRRYPDSPLARKLRQKYFWHRVVRGSKFRKCVPFVMGMDFVEARLSGREGQIDPERDILLITHEMSMTGAPRALLTLAEALKRSGYRPVIITLRGGGLIAEAEEAGIPVVANLCEILKEGISPTNGHSVISRFVMSFSTIVYNTLDSMMKFPPIHAPGTRRIGWIHEAEGGYSRMDLEHDFDALIDSFDKICIVGDLARSHAMKRSQRAAGFVNLYYGVAPLDCNLSQERVCFDDGRLHLLMAGMVEQRKGHHILAEALNMLDRKILSEVYIHAVGPVPHPKLRDKLLKAGRGSVSVPGTMPHDDLMRLFAGVDGLICPSLDDPMPIVCTEAFQLGVPVLVSDHTGTASFIRDGENGFLVKAGDASSLADGIRRMVAIRGQLPQIGAAARSIYEEHFSMAAFERNVADLFPPLS